MGNDLPGRLDTERARGRKRRMVSDRVRWQLARCTCRSLGVKCLSISMLMSPQQSMYCRRL
jgi:hypothetical protein